MRLLLLTGKLAAKRVVEEAKKIEAELGHHVEVHVLDVDVAALMNVRWLKKALRPMRGRLEDYDAIVLPGYTSGSVIELEGEFGVKFVKGTKHICDLLGALKRMGITAFSTDVPADFLLEKSSDVEERLRAVEEAMGAYVEVGAIRVPLRPPPMRVISEVYYGRGTSPEELIEECRFRAREGADVICLGVREPDIISSDELSPILKKMRDELPTLAIDSPRPAHVREALRHGFDMVMSISLDNIGPILSACALEPSAAYVLVAPREIGPKGKLKAIEHMISEVERAGARKIIVDPLLEPPIEPGIANSLEAYGLFRERLTDRPMLMGLCNVVELVDADSHGLAILLAILAGELGVSLLLITEESQKTKGSTAEVSTAAKMVSIALHERRHPKDMGISLLKLKDKVNRDVWLTKQELSGVRTIDCPSLREETSASPPDRTGFFKIALDRRAGLILVLYRGEKGPLLLRAPRARPILRMVIEQGLVGTQEHLAYLAVELTKAEIALRAGKSYVQDEELF